MPFFTEGEVAIHNSYDDCWVSVFENVFDLTELIADNRGEMTRPLEKAAGQNISHWFDSESREVKTHIDPVRNIRLPYTPEGRFVHVPPPDAREWDTSLEKPWWKDEKFIVGKLTAKKRLIKIMNMLTKTEDTVYTCQEETVAEIQNRYVEYNKHSDSYTWKALIDGEFVVLDVEKTLEENGVPDETENFYQLGLDDDFYVPTLHLYFNDDLTYA
jgi:hypothetical protein